MSVDPGSKDEQETSMQCRCILATGGETGEIRTPEQRGQPDT